MPNPKTRHSKSRRDKRRTHDALTPANVVTCPTTGEPHLRHNAYWHEDKMYYKGRVVIDSTSADTSASS